MADTPTVFQALAAVARDVGAVAKNRKAQGGDSYKYRGIEDVLNALHSPLATHGVVLVPRVVDHDQQLDPYKLGDKGWNRTRVVVEYDVYGPAGDKVDQPVRVVGDALDNSDKGWGKAMSYAYKTALGQLFHLPTEDDNEATAIPDEPARRAPRPSRRPAAPTPEGEPFGGPIDYADQAEVDAVLGEITSLPKKQRDEMRSYMTAKNLKALQANRDQYPKLLLNVIEAQLRRLQDEADQEGTPE